MNENEEVLMSIVDEMVNEILKLFDFYLMGIARTQLTEIEKVMLAEDLNKYFN